MNLVLDQGRLAVSGVGRDRFTYAYRGTGRVFGVKFRPGAFLPFLGRPLVEITGAVLPAERLWGPAATALAARLTATAGVDGLVGLAEEFLRARSAARRPAGASWSGASWRRCCTTVRSAGSTTSPSGSG